MNYLEDIINKRLKKNESVARKQITVSLQQKNLDELDIIANTIAKTSGRSASRNTLIEDAIEAYICTSKKAFEENNINLVYSKDDLLSFDTVVFPAYPDGFRQAFLNDNKWYYVRVKADKIPKIKYVAIYVGVPISAITHYAKINSAIFENGFEWNENEQRYIIHFDGEAIELENPIPLGNAQPASVRAPRYTTLQKLLTTDSYDEL